MHENAVYVTMASVTSYYFSSTKEFPGKANVDKAVRLAYMKHAGSIAYGSVVHMNAKILRMFPSWVCESCLYRFYDGALLYIHKTAYVYQSIFGEEYFTSAKMGFIINLKHNSDIFLANSYAEFYISICKIFIVVLNTLISWFVGML